MLRKCVSVILDTFQITFTGTKTYRIGLSDTITIYQSEHPVYRGRVVAISRQLIERGNEIDFRAEMIKKYGKVFYQVSNDDAFWFQTAKTHNRIIEDETFAEKCFSGTPWPLEGNTLKLGAFRTDCGNYIAMHRNSMFLVDIGYVNRFRTKAIDTFYVNEKKVKVTF